MKHPLIHKRLIQGGTVLWMIVFCWKFTVAQVVVTTYAGDGTAGLVNGDTVSCKFRSPDGICSDPFGNLFIADGDNDCIRKITPAGIVTTYAGSGVAGYLDGPDSIAQFRSPFDICMDNDGNMYVSDFENQYIRKISADGMVSTVAGNGIAGYVDGPAATAEFNYPRGIVRDASGNLYVSDSWNHRIRKIDASGVVSTYAGGGNIFGVQSVSEFKDGADTTARFYTPCGLSIDAEGNIYVADAYNHRVRKIDPSRIVTTVAGTGLSGSTGGGYADGDTALARFNTLTELYIAPSGYLYVGDTYNNRIRLIANGQVSTIAGSGTAGYLDGLDTVAKFNHPRGLLLDSTGKHLIVCDGNNRRIRKVNFNMPVGVEVPAGSGGWAVFPNPSSGLFFISGLVSGKEIRVMNMIGTEIFTGIYFGDKYLLDVKAYPAGIYLVQIENERGNRESYKICKTE